MELNALENEKIHSTDDNILGSEKISKLFIKFSIPAIISMLILGMQSVVDGIFVGNFIGSNAMASVSMASPFMQVIFGITLLMSVGAISYIGRSLGEGNIKLAQNILRTSLIVLVSASLFLTILGIFFSNQIATVLGANAVLFEGVTTYIKTISIFTIPLALSIMLGFINRLVERPDLYFKGMVASLFTNIILNYFLVAKFGLGIKGAAIATGMSYTMVLIVVLSPMLKKSNVINIFVGNFDKSTIIPVMYNGASEGVSYASAAISAFLFNMAFIKLVGENGIAAFTSINYVAQFGSLIAFGIVDGIGSIVSYNYGAKRFDRLKEILSLSIKITFTACFITFAVLFFFSENLVSLFMSAEQDVLDIAVSGSKIYAFAFLINGLNVMCSSYFTAIGYAKESIIIAAFRGLVFIIIGIVILPAMLGINGIWMTIPFAEFITLITCIVLLKKYLKSSGHFKDLKV